MSKRNTRQSTKKIKFNIEDKFDESVMENISPTCALIGCISVGKSTFMNSLFATKYSDTKIRRTTMIPQVYIERKNKIYDETINEILENNRTVNNNFLNGEIPLTKDTCQEVIHYVEPIFEFADLPTSCNLKIYDIPGLNDCVSSNIYYHWISNNFYKFDIIFYIVDVKSSMNTSDERDSIKMIIQNIKKEQSKNHNIKLCIILNKCDDISLDDKDNIELDEEHNELMKQVEDIVNDEFKANDLENYKWLLCPLSSQDSFICRTLQKNPTMEIDKVYRDKIGLEYFGKIQWKKMTDTQKTREISKIVKTKDFDERLKQCGFYQLREKINKEYLNNQNALNFVISKFKLFLDTINNINIDFNKDFNSNISEGSSINSFITHYHKCHRIIDLVYKDYGKSYNLNDIVSKHIDTKLDEWNTTLPRRKPLKGINYNYKPDIIINEDMFNKKQLIKEILKYLDESLPDFYKMNSIVWIDAISTEQNEYLINNMNGTLESLNHNLDRLQQNKCDKKFNKRIVNKFIKTCDPKKYYYERMTSSEKNMTDNKNIKDLIKLLDTLQEKNDFSTKEVIEIVQNIFDQQIHFYINNYKQKYCVETEIMWYSIKIQIENMFIVDHMLILSNEEFRKYLLNIKMEFEILQGRDRLNAILYKDFSKQNNIDFYEKGKNLIIFNYLYDLIKNYYS